MAIDQGQLKVVEATLKGWLESGIHPSVIACGLNNAFAYGDALTKGDFDFDSDILAEIYEGIEKFRKGSIKVN